MTTLDLADGLRLLDAASSDERFGHREHLAFAWALLDEAEDPADAARVALLTIRHMTEVAGSPEKFHATVTVFWIKTLAHIRGTSPPPRTVDEALATFPFLSDRDLPRRHFSTLDDERSRREWVEPDLEPMP